MPVMEGSRTLTTWCSGAGPAPLVGVRRRGKRRLMSIAPGAEGVTFENSGRPGVHWPAACAQGWAHDGQDYDHHGSAQSHGANLGYPHSRQQSSAPMGAKVLAVSLRAAP